MLVACRKNGEKISLGEHWKRNDLDLWRREEGFSCPQCGERVILKLGNKRIWHFAHQKNSDCVLEYERESEYHMAGKLQLYQWLREQNIAAELEKYISGCKQRADIAFQWRQEKYAVEFQCSPIAEDLLAKRTEGYKNHGFTPIWIPAGNQLRRTSANTLMMSEFQFLFLRKQGNNWVMPAYCADTRQFIFLHHILPISSAKVIAALKPISRTELTLPDFFKPLSVKPHSFAFWVKELDKMKLNYLHYPGKMQKRFLNEIYINRLNLFTLPTELGLPVPSALFIQTPPLLWQTFLYLDHFHHAPQGHLIATSDILHSFLERVKKQQIQLRRLPLEDSGDFRYALREYLDLLAALSLLDKVNHRAYRIARPFKDYKSSVEKQQAESIFWNTYGHHIMAQC